MAWREYDLARDAIAATDQEIFDQVMPPRQQSIYDEDPDEYEPRVIDSSRDRRLEAVDRIDGQGTVDAVDQYDDARWPAIGSGGRAGRGGRKRRAYRTAHQRARRGASGRQ